MVLGLELWDREFREWFQGLGLKVLGFRAT